MPVASALVRASLLMGAFLLAGCSRTSSGESLHSFAGETVRIIVGFSPGGHYDVHARLTAAHLGRHLPGQPAVVVENMPGAGGKVAASHLAHVVRPDGLTIAHLGESNAADAVDSDLLARLQILVSPAPLTPVMVFSARSGIASVDDWRRADRAPRIASSGPGAATYVVPRLAGRALGLPIEMVSGYAGSAEMRLALEGGEVDGVCLSLDTFRMAFSASPGLRAVLRFSRDPLPGLDAPDAMSLATDDTARALLETGVYAMSGLERFYAAPRGVPAPRLALLREGLTRTLADPQFLAAAAAAGLTVAPLTAGELEERLRLIATRHEILGVVRSIVSGH